MAIKINFDVANIPENPTLILATRKGDKIGKINAQNIVIKDSMTDGAEITFSVNKYINNVIDSLWNNIKDYKLVYCKEADLWFQAKVDIDELSNTVKNVSCIQLAQAELSQIMLYNIEINTENDIARDDYINPTVLYNDNDHSISLLHRIMGKVFHYQIVYVSPTITNIQRTFTFNDTSLYDAFQNIAKEIGCLFIYHSDTDSNGNIRRGISVYDLESYCSTCGNRGHFTNTCPKCNGVNILEGYGEDTTIFITAGELGKDIKFTSNTDSQKNCFKLEAGDDLMTATIRNCNPNGTDYIWYISDDTKEDMSTELVTKLNDYDTLYNTYNTTYSMTIGTTLMNKYNQLVAKYSTLRPDFTALISPIVGYGNLMTAYYQTIDFAMYLQSEMLPTVTISQINANTEVIKLTANNISPVAVINTSSLSLETANNAVLSVAKCLINPNYKITISSSNLSGITWNGVFYIENYSDENDNATSESITITITNNYTNYVNQKIQKVLSQSKQDTMDIVSLFDMSLSDFTNELKKYNLDSLNTLQSICQSCIDVMIEQGIAVNQSWNGTNLYNNLYMNYYNKLLAINNEQSTREYEVNIITGKYIDGKLTNQGIQNALNKHILIIQSALNLENYLGSELWLEFCAYKREGKYSNTNYISDGLNNAELFEKALEFIEKARKELYTSAELQHSISASLVNLLVIPKFKILTQYFKVGNWLRVLVDDNVYKLRLISYEIDYNNLENISVEFSDILSTADGYTDEQSLMQKMSSIATSYGYTQHQAEQGSKTHRTVNDWVEKGLNVTNNKIIQGSSNQTQTWDEHGMLFRQFDYEIDDYDDCQLKIINSTLAVTDDNWLTVKTAVGKYYYIDPSTNQVTYAFGTNAETIVGKLILGERLGIYNSSGSLTFNNNGLNVSNGINTFNVNPNSNNLVDISKNTNGNIDNLLYLDSNGTLHIKGDGSALDITANNSITGLSSQISQTAESITSTVANSQSKYDVGNMNIDLYGYGNPSSTTYPPSNYSSQYYLNQSNGDVWYSNSTEWNKLTTLSLITSNLKTQITQNQNDITAIVSRNGSGTIVSLDSEKVKIAWNGIATDQSIQIDTVSNRAGLSIYNSSFNRIVRLDNGGFNINNSSGSDLLKLNTEGLNLYGRYDNDNNTYLLMALNSTGQTYYYKTDTNSNPVGVGSIGTGGWTGNSSARGLVMRLKYEGSYLAWSYQDTANGNYMVKLVYFAYDAGTTKKGLHIMDDTYLDSETFCGNKLWFNDYVRTKRDSSGDAGLYSDSKCVYIEGTTAYVKGISGTFEIANGGYTFTHSTNGINCLNDINMNNYSINNVIINSSSDVRMKANIVDTNVNAIDVLNQVEMKSFDWRIDNKHEDIGIIAQQLQEVLPDLVCEDKQTTKLSIQPIKFIPYLIKAIQELSEKINNGSTNQKVKNNRVKQNRYNYSKQEIDDFLCKIKPKEKEYREQQEEIIVSKPIYLENEFKKQERNKK